MTFGPDESNWIWDQGGGYGPNVVRMRSGSSSLERTVDVEGCAAGVYANRDVPVAGGDVVRLIVCDAIFLVYESCEDFACLG